MRIGFALVTLHLRSTNLLKDMCRVPADAIETHVLRSGIVQKTLLDDVSIGCGTAFASVACSCLTCGTLLS